MNAAVLEFVIFSNCVILLVPLYFYLKGKRLLELCIAPRKDVLYPKDDLEIEGSPLSLLARKSPQYGIFLFPSRSFKLIFLYSAITFTLIVGVVLNSISAAAFLFIGHVSAYVIVAIILSSNPVLKGFWLNRPGQLDAWFVSKFPRVSILKRHKKLLRGSNIKIDQAFLEHLNSAGPFIRLLSRLPLRRRIDLNISNKRIRILDHTNQDDTYYGLLKWGLIDFLSVWDDDIFRSKIIRFIMLLMSPLIVSYAFFTLSVILKIGEPDFRTLLYFPFLLWIIFAAFTITLMFQFIYSFKWDIEYTDLSRFGKTMTMSVTNKSMRVKRIMLDKKLPILVGAISSIASLFSAVLVGMIENMLK